MAALDFSPDALQDIKEHFQYHGDYSEKAEQRFADRLDEAFGNLEQFPEIGRERPNLGHGLRGFPINALRLTVFYRFNWKQDTITISSVLRQERDIEAAFGDE